MDIATAKLILRSEVPESASDRELSGFLVRKRRVFLQVLHEILSRRNDKGGTLNEWVECLLCLAERGHRDGLEDFPVFLLRLAAFQQYREKKESLPDRNKKGSKISSSDSNNAKALLRFLSMPDMVKIMNDTIEETSFSPSEMDWMALNFLFRHELINKRLYPHILLLASGSQGLSGLLEITPEAWKASIGYVLRQKIENIIFILFKVLSDESDKYDLMLTLCGKSLFNISLRLEVGIESDREGDTEDSKGLDAGFFSSSDEEEDEDDKAAESKGLLAQTPGFDDENPDDEDNDGAFSLGGGASKMQDMMRRCIQAEENLPAYRSSWCELCLTAVTILHERLIEGKRAEETKNLREMEQQPQSKRGSGRGGTAASVLPPNSSMAHQGFSDAISSLNSRTWQRQLLSLDTLMDILVKGKGKGSEGGGSRSSKASASSRRRGGGSSKKAAQVIQPLEELSRSGSLRHICWGLVSSRGRVRASTSALLGTILDLSSNDQDTVGVNLWAAFVEQGLVPVLEMVRLGYPVDQIPSRTSGLTEDESVRLFPERSIRELVDAALRMLVERLCSMNTLRVRLASALLHSGNPALRLNIFVALLFLARKSGECGLCIWQMSTPSQAEGSAPRKKDTFSSSGGGKRNQEPTAAAAAVGEVVSGQGEVFLGMLKGMLRDTTELKTILAVIAHTVRTALEIKKASNSGLQAERSLDVADRGEDKLRKSKQRGGSGSGPTVVVQDGGSRIKMACPEPSTVRRHSRDLAEILREMAEREAAREADVFAPVDEASLPSLSGSYSLWQEVFSHMTNDQIQDPSITRMALDQVVDAFHIARKYRMALLLDKYAAALGNRLSADTIVTVWSCALGKEMVNGVLVGPPPLLSNSSASSGAIGDDFLPPPRQERPANPPSSPTAASASQKFEAQRTIGRGTRAHLGLLSTCLDWLEKAGAAAFSQKRPLLAAELLELTHQTLGIVITA